MFPLDTYELEPSEPASHLKTRLAIRRSILWSGLRTPLLHLWYNNGTG